MLRAQTRIRALLAVAEGLALRGAAPADAADGDEGHDRYGCRGGADADADFGACAQLDAVVRAGVVGLEVAGLWDRLPVGRRDGFECLRRVVAVAVVVAAAVPLVLCLVPLDPGLFELRCRWFTRRQLTVRLTFPALLACFFAPAGGGLEL